MKIQFWAIGKIHEPYVRQGVEDFSKRITNYYTIDWRLFLPAKQTSNTPEASIKKNEGETIIAALQKDDYLVLLDETGKQLSSVHLSHFIQQRAVHSTRNLIFLIGGAYGVDEQIKQRANFSWSLSQLVFPHQLVRLILAEQVYRACTIIRNEKYHHV